MRGSTIKQVLRRCNERKAYPASTIRVLLAITGAKQRAEADVLNLLITLLLQLLQMHVSDGAADELELFINQHNPYPRPNPTQHLDMQVLNGAHELKTPFWDLCRQLREGHVSSRLPN